MGFFSSIQPLVASSSGSGFLKTDEEFIKNNWEMIMQDIIQTQNITDVEVNNRIKPFKIYTMTNSDIFFFWDGEGINEKQALERAKNNRYDKLIQHAIYKYLHTLYNISFVVLGKDEKLKQEKANMKQDIETSQKVSEINHSLFVEDKNLRTDMKEMLEKMKEQLEILEKAISGTMFVDDYITMMESITSMKEKEDVLEKLKVKIAGIYDKNL